MRRALPRTVLVPVLVAFLLPVQACSTANTHAAVQRQVSVAQPSTFPVFATRLGMVGQTTASGHRITARDHFVALPSRRALAKSGAFYVRVCAPTGRCETAPVLEVGPWNTTDDYWNPPAQRESGQDLTQGMPEAQAAYQTGYHGGHDVSGRRVTNPAGIGLGDGTYWDGLGLTGDCRVMLTILWI